MTIGQVILAVRDLDGATSSFEAKGFTVIDGGVHPGLGTANRVIPLGSSYLELLGVVGSNADGIDAFAISTPSGEVVVSGPRRPS